MGNFFTPGKHLTLRGLEADVRQVAELDCGYGSFTLAAARLCLGTVHAFDSEPEMIERVRGMCRRERLTNVRLELRDFVADGTR